MNQESKRMREAVALSYQAEQMNAPQVIAKGKGYIAEKIIDNANELQIPIQTDPSLVEMLGKLNLNKTIPEELYGAVAEIFAFVYRLDKSLKSKN